MEPPGPDPFLVEDIYMVKNIVTELTYRILFEIVTAEATRNQDYETTLATSLLDFPPNQQRFQLFNTGFPFAILPDITQEGEETVEISSEPVDNPPPAYTRPQTRAVTTLFILDDDSKNNDQLLQSLYHLTWYVVYFIHRYHSWLGPDLLYCV